jgi:hypothetical protein
MKLRSTSQASTEQGIKMLVHGPAGAGKTRLCATLPDPLIISAEAGLLSLSEFDIPFVSVNTMNDVTEVYEALKAGNSPYQSIALDSVSEIAEVVLANEKSMTKDPRKAYGELIEKMTALLRAFRDLPQLHVYMSCKQQQQIEGETTYHSCSLPGAKLSQQIAYLFDEVFALRVNRSDDGIRRVLQTAGDSEYEAKDRSGKLDEFEDADLGAIINKIKGEV